MANRVAAISDVLKMQPVLTDLDSLRVRKPMRLRIIREFLGDEFLATMHPNAVIAAADGAYHFTPTEAKDFMRIAAALSKTSIHMSRLGRGTLLHKEISRLRSL